MDLFAELMEEEEEKQGFSRTTQDPKPRLLLALENLLSRQPALLGDSLAVWADQGNTEMVYLKYHPETEMSLWLGCWQDGGSSGNSKSCGVGYEKGFGMSETIGRLFCYVEPSRIKHWGLCASETI